jgi:hypothetical protein
MSAICRIPKEADVELELVRLTRGAALEGDVIVEDCKS